jgi:hypothetical protein
MHRNLLHKYGVRRSWEPIWNSLLLALLFGGLAPLVKRPSSGDPHVRAWLDGPVREAAQVFMNDRAVGSVWKPPYELEISRGVHLGENHPKIIVGNLAIDTLAGHSLPDRRLLNSKYGARAIAQDVENLQPLPSGPVGPLRLVIEQEPSHGGN